LKLKSAAPLILFATLFFFWGSSASLYGGDDANVSYVSRGFSRVLTSVFQIPYHLISKTMNEPLVFGTVNGAMTGTYHAVQDLSGGTFDIVRGVIPYAKYLIFFV